MQFYAITNRRLFPSREALLEQAALWAEGRVDYVQIREKDLPFDELATLATQLVRAVRAVGRHTRILLNGPVEIALATGCDGVHFPSDLSVDAIALAGAAMREVLADPVISVSCHTIVEVKRARDHGATLGLFAPVFEKRLDTGILPGQGLATLAEACRAGSPMSVFALGGITVANAKDCVEAGAIGVAAIRLFASRDWLGLR